jgi:hypothetical protein
MKIDNRIDYRALTADHFTTYTQPGEIRKGIDHNRNLLADIAALASRTIAHQARNDSLRPLLGGAIDLLV